MKTYRTGLLGKKLGMTQLFTAEGNCRPVTVIQATNVVVAKRTIEKDGYTAVQLGFDEQPMTAATKPELGHFAKAGVAPQRVVTEVRVAPADLDKYEIGKKVPLDTIFKTGTFVDIVGTSKGKGFQGVMKKFNFSGKPRSHGTHEFFRHGGSLGCRLTPGRVWKNKKMPGQMGDERVTVQNLTIIEMTADQDLLLIGGSVPGGKNGVVLVKNAYKKTGSVKVKGTGDTQEKSKNPMKASKAGAGTTKKAK